MDQGVKDALDVGARLLPSIVDLVGGLIAGGMSPDEAEAVVRRDIESRREQYEKERAEDEAALAAKHRREPKIVVDYRAPRITPPLGPPLPGNPFGEPDPEDA